MRAHLPAESLRAEEVAGQVDGEHAVPFGKRQGVERAGTQDRRGVHQHAGGPERFLDRLRRGGDTLGAGRIAANDEMAVAQFSQLRLRRLKPAFVAMDRRPRAPALAKLTAVARPMPPPPPVTTQTRPDRPSRIRQQFPVLCDHSYLVS